MDSKTARMQAEREHAEETAEREEEYQSYDGVPLPEGPPADIYGDVQPGSVQRSDG